VTLALVINATAVITLMLLLGEHERQPLEAIAAMAAKRGEYALGVRAAVWCERRDRARTRVPHRPPVARGGVKPAAQHSTRRTLAGGIRR
jgi:hypothetical protein